MSLVVSQEVSRACYRSREGLPGPEVARNILIDVADAFNVSPREILGPRRFSYLTKPRRELWRRLHAHGWSASRIARFSNRNHATVLYGLGRRNQRLFVTMTDRELILTYETVYLHLARREGTELTSTTAGQILAPTMLPLCVRRNYGYEALKRFNRRFGSDRKYLRVSL